MRYAPRILVLYLGTEERAPPPSQEPSLNFPKMLNAKPLENNFAANQKYAKCAENLISAWNKLDQESRRIVVGALNKEHGINSDIHNHEVAIKILEEKLKGEFKNFI